MFQDFHFTNENTLIDLCIVVKTTNIMFFFAEALFDFLLFHPPKVCMDTVFYRYNQNGGSHNRYQPQAQ